MKAIAAQVDTIAGLRVFDHPVDTINPPTALVALPRINFDGAYGRGMDRWELPLMLMTGKVVDRAARDAMGPYVSGSGAKSIKQVVEAGTYTAFHTVRVTGCEFDVVTFGAVDYLAATFTLDIAGAGA